MKGVILHAGHGTRLRPLTHTGPKQLLPIANKPMSNYCVDTLIEAGIKEIAFIIGCLLYTSPSPRDRTRSRMPSSA